ncbi:MAG: lactonase family protein [Proteobacteria bacterium]|nr:lactonase family protein [Pseudomonadota bacterium]
MPRSPHTSLVAIGTYTERMPHVAGKGAGIHLRRFDLATGLFGAEFIAGGLRNPTYLTVTPAGDRLYAVCEIDAAEGPTLETFAIDRDALTLTHLAATPIAGGWPCHLSLNADATQLYVANYQTGDVLIMALDASGVPAGALGLPARPGSGPNADRQEAAHAHCVVPSPDGRHLYICDLGTDEIVRHPVVGSGVTASPDLVIPATPGAGPRHILFSPSGRSLLAIHELSSTISLHGMANPGRMLAEISTLPEGWTGQSTCAAIRIHPSGRFVYASNRGHDSVFVAELDEAAGQLRAVGSWPAGGRTPRDIAISPDGRFLLAASQDEDRIRVFAIDPATGALTPTDETLDIASPVCLCFLPQPTP